MVVVEDRDKIDDGIKVEIDKIYKSHFNLWRSLFATNVQKSIYMKYSLLIRF